MTSNIANHALTVTSPLMEGLERVMRNPYHPTIRKEGIINLGTAENKLLEKELISKMKDITARDDFISQEILYYGCFYGSDTLREKLAQFFNKYLNADINAGNIVCSSGAGSAVCNFAQVFLNPGDKVGVPIPFYGGFDFDLTLYTGAVISGLKENDKDQDIKLLVLTNPQNPTGQIYEEKELLKWLNWAKELKIPVILDEIYALSTFVYLLVYLIKRMINSFQDWKWNFQIQ